MPHYWSLLVIRDKFNPQKVKDALHMAKGRFETIKLYNLSANDLVRLGKVLQQASPAVKTLYFETTECSSIIAIASLRLKPESFIVRNEDPRGPPIPPIFDTLRPIFGPTMRSLSFHRPPSRLHWPHDLSWFRHLTSLIITGFRFGGLPSLHHMTMIEEIVLDFKETFLDQNESRYTRPDISLPSLRVFKLRHAPCSAEMSSPTIRIHAPMLRTFHLDSTSAALWLEVFSAGGPPTALVDFRVDRPNGSAMGLHHLLPFLCDTIESFVLTSVPHELGPLLKDIEAGIFLPGRKHLEFTFRDE